MNINPKHLTSLKVTVFETFLAVAEKGSFSHAAELRSLTPAAVTTQIKQLEEILGDKLFVRGRDQATLTDSGIEMLRFARTMVEGISSLQYGLKNTSEMMIGTVKYAMPHSCLLSPHFSMLLEKRKEFPGINLVVELLLNEEVLSLIRQNKADFGFVTEKVASPVLKYEHFCEEEYIMVSASQTIPTDISEENLLAYPFVGHPSFDQLFTHWKAHFMPGLKGVNATSLNVANYFNWIDGAIKMVIGGLGVSVFPRHTVQEYIDAGSLYEWSPDKGPLFNNIFIIQHVDAQANPRVRKVIEWFLNMHSDEKPK